MVWLAVRVTVTAFAVCCCLAAPARAGEAACWYERGVLVVPASVMGVAGDYILDTGTAHTELAETQAQTAGFAETALLGEVRVADVRMAKRSVAVADIDVRTGLFPTPIAGVIGADVLAPYVLEVRYAPCRVALNLPAQAPRPAAGAEAPLHWRSGLPVVQAGVADGPRAWRGGFVVATGADRALRLSDDAATAPAASKPGAVYPYGVLVPRLRALSFAGALFENVEAGLLKAGATPGDGAIGPGVLARFTLRFDFPAGRLRLTPNEKGPPETGGP